MTNAIVVGNAAERPNSWLTYGGSYVPSLEEQAQFFILQRPARATSFHELRELYRDHLAGALAQLIIRFEGPHMKVDKRPDARRGGRSRSRKTFLHLAELVAKRAVNNVLGSRFGTLDYLLFVKHLVELRKDADRRIAQGEFKKNGFYSRIVELMNTTAPKPT